MDEIRIAKRIFENKSEGRTWKGRDKDSWKMEKMIYESRNRRYEGKRHAISKIGHLS
jgi:hypothetical protein